MFAGSGGGFEGDSVAEGCEFTDVVAFLGAGAEAAGVVVGAGVGIDRIDAAQHLVQQEPVVVIEVPGEGLLLHGIFVRIPDLAISARTLGVALTGDQGSHHRPTRDSEMSEATKPSKIVPAG